MHPFTKRRRGSVGGLGEIGLIGRMRGWLGAVCPAGARGIGDDCAVLDPSRQRQLITTDPLIYGRHFDDRVPPRGAGEKLLKRNLSDLAAMGARPVAAVVSLALDPHVRLDWLEQFHRGLAAAARRYRVSIVGGDIAECDGQFAAFLTLTGVAAGPRILLRTGARRGDWIFVTGTLGGSRRGRHWRFVPRLAEGAWLTRRPEVRAMLDVSDGLAKDLPALAPPGTEPVLIPGAVPLSGDARRAACRSGRPPLHHALCDGEDYELAFAVTHRADQKAFAHAWRRAFPGLKLSCIGRFLPAGALPPGSLRLTDLHGYEHLHAGRSGL